MEKGEGKTSTRLGGNSKIGYREKQMDQIVFDTSNKTTLKGEREKELIQETSEHIWTTRLQAKGKTTTLIMNSN